MEKAGDLLNGLIISLANLGISYYLLIDEYDNFANNILIEHGRGTYKQITRAGGFLRSFFAVIKNGTENRSIERLFVTGVSPLVLSDVTSGMNIGRNISLLPKFSNMIGLTEEEVTQLVEYYISHGLIKAEDRATLLSIIRDYSNNYHFGEEGAGFYNTDMVLYIVDEYMARGKIPYDPIDPNIRTDYGKLRFLIIESGKVNGNFNILQEVLDKNKTKGTLIDSFAIKEIIDKEKFRSLLYYLGLLTIKNISPGGRYIFNIPNLSVYSLLWEYIRRAIGETFGLRIDTDLIQNLFEEMAFNGNWKSLFEYLLKEFYEVIKSNRDFIWREEGVVMFLLTYLTLSKLYIVEHEYETTGGDVDIFLRKNWFTTGLTRYEYLIELKHIKQVRAYGIRPNRTPWISRIKRRVQPYAPAVKTAGNRTDKQI